MNDKILYDETWDYNAEGYVKQFNEMVMDIFTNLSVDFSSILGIDDTNYTERSMKKVFDQYCNDVLAGNIGEMYGENLGDIMLETACRAQKRLSGELKQLNDVLDAAYGDTSIGKDKYNIMYKKYEAIKNIAALVDTFAAKLDSALKAQATGSSANNAQPGLSADDSYGFDNFDEFDEFDDFDEPDEFDDLENSGYAEEVGRIYDEIMSDISSPLTMCATLEIDGFSLFDDLAENLTENIIDEICSKYNNCDMFVQGYIEEDLKKAQELQKTLPAKLNKLVDVLDEACDDDASVDKDEYDAMCEKYEAAKNKIALLDTFVNKVGAAIKAKEAQAAAKQAQASDKNMSNTRVNIDTSTFEKIFGKIEEIESGSKCTEIKDDLGDHIAHEYKKGKGEAALYKEAFPLYRTEKFGDINDFTFSPLRKQFYYAKGKEVYDQNKNLVASFEHNIWDILYVNDILIITFLEKLNYKGQHNEEWMHGDYGWTYALYHTVSSTVFYDLNSKKIIGRNNDISSVKTAMLRLKDGALLLMDGNLYGFDPKNGNCRLLCDYNKGKEIHGDLFENSKGSLVCYDRGLLIKYCDGEFIDYCSNKHFKNLPTIK